MKITNKALKIESYKNKTLYYPRARDGMFDLVNSMKNANKINCIFLPAYIGWSHKEGSGIFDPINRIDDLQVQYYKMNEELNIDTIDLFKKIKLLNKGTKFIVLLVNYFGFTDPKLNNIIDIIKSYSGWILIDNAHGLFTYYNSPDYSDATFFSLHKMLPFEHGGSLIINNEELAKLKLDGQQCPEHNPLEYNLTKISHIRLSNYEKLKEIIDENGEENFIPLKKTVSTGDIPQSFPIIIRKGNRDKIYQLLNDNGFGVVSLYHTLINPLMTEEFTFSIELSKRILNLPVHQDVDTDKYYELVELLKLFCIQTSLT